MNELHSRYADQGLVILGAPCNQFGHQVRLPTVLGLSSVRLLIFNAISNEFKEKCLNQSLNFF